MSMDIAGLVCFREASIARLNMVREEVDRAIVSLCEWREGNGDSTPVPRSPIHQYWRKRWPSGQFPAEADWTLIRGELKASSLVFVRVGPAESASVWVRLFALVGEPSPTNATFVGWSDADDAKDQLLCPRYGRSPGEALWECIIYSTRMGA